MCNELTIFIKKRYSIANKCFQFKWGASNFFSYSFVAIKFTTQIKVLHFVRYFWFKPTNTMVADSGMYPKWSIAFTNLNALCYICIFFELIL